MPDAAGLKIVIAGTREDWPGRAQTLTPRDPTTHGGGTATGSGARPGTARFPVDGCSGVRQGDGLRTRGREVEPGLRRLATRAEDADDGGETMH